MALTVTAQPVGEPIPTRLAGWRTRRAQAKVLAFADRTAAHTAGLWQIRGLLKAAQEVVARGWIQHGWWEHLDECGQPQLWAGGVEGLTGRPISGACLVGAIVRAGGEPLTAHSQPVARALDLTWHTLFREGSGLAVTWCPAPAVRTLQVRDLTRWNDARDRTPDQVAALLAAARCRADAELQRQPLAV